MKHLASLADFINKEIGLKGTTKRNKFDRKVEAAKRRILKQSESGKCLLLKN